MTYYTSIDIETSGPDPMKNMLLSIGAVTVNIHQVKKGRAKCTTISEFYVNLTQNQPGREWNPDTKDWWNGQKEAFASLSKGPILSPEKAIPAFVDFLFPPADNKFQPISMVFYPTTFDYRFLTHYVSEFEKDPNARNSWFHKDNLAVDLRSFASGLLYPEPKDCGRAWWRQEWIPENKMPHNALEDAKSQMYSFIKMMEYKSTCFK